MMIDINYILKNTYKEEFNIMHNINENKNKNTFISE